MVRRLLLVTYYFPPAGGAGTLRALRFARYLRDAGWQPTVVCASPLPGAVLDRSLQNAIPSHVPVHPVSSLEPGRFSDSWKQPAQKVIRNLFRTFDYFLVPDEHVGWVRPGLRASASLFEQDARFDAVFTTGPPFSTHLIGLHLRRRYNIPWVADFRDDWTGFNDTFRGGAQRRRPEYERRLENEVLRKATVVLTINEALRETLARRAPGARVEVIPNGYDPIDFEGTAPVGRAHAPFVISHAGSLYEQRSPARFLEALRSWSAEEDLRDRFKVRFLGRVVGPVPTLLAAPDLRHVVQYDGIVSHGESVEAMRRSDALLLIIDQVQQAEQIWTGKVFEYIGARRPILALMPGEGSLARLLREDWTGHEIVSSDDVEGIKAALKRMVTSASNEVPCVSSVVSRFRADHLTQHLASLLEEVVDRGGAVVPASLYRPKLDPIAKQS